MKRNILFSIITLCFVGILICVLTHKCPEPVQEEAPEPVVKEKVVFKGSFLEVFKKATELVVAECPGAEFYEADAAIADPGMTADDVKGWKFVFNFPEYRTAFISYEDSLFSNVTVVDSPWLEDCIIRELKMDLPEAVTLMRKANYNDKFVDLTVRWPLYPGTKEPFYIFSCPELGWVFVGTNSKKVKLQPFM